MSSAYSRVREWTLKWLRLLSAVVFWVAVLPPTAALVDVAPGATIVETEGYRMARYCIYSDSTQVSTTPEPGKVRLCTFSVISVSFLA